MRSLRNLTSAPNPTCREANFTALGPIVCVSGGNSGIDHARGDSRLQRPGIEEINSPKNERGSIPSPFQQNPISPRPKKPGTSPPRENQNHLPCVIASALPRVRNSWPDLEQLIQQGLASADSVVQGSRATKSTVFHRIRLVFYGLRKNSCADGRPNRGGDGFRPVSYILGALGFDHDSCLRLST